MKLIKILSILSVLAALSASHAQAFSFVIYPGDNGFESPNEGAPGYGAAPTGTPWTFSANTGIVSNGAAPYAAGATQGQASDSDVSSAGQAAYLQYAGSSISQSVNISTSGIYNISFVFETQPGAGQIGNEITVSLGGDTVYDGTPTSQSAFTPVTTGLTGFLTAGFYTLEFDSLGGAGGGTPSTLIDDISISAVPETSNWGWLVALGMVGAVALRRFRQQTPA